MATAAPPQKPGADSAPNTGWKPEYHEIPLDAIDVGGNVRTAVDGLDDLAASVRANGIRTPIRVADIGAGRYELVYGQRRLAAAREAGLTTIPAIVDAEQPDRRDRTVDQLVENLQREDLNALDTAKAYRWLLDKGLTQRQLAERMGVAQPTIANTLALLKAPEAIQERVAAGELTRSHVEQLRKLPAAEQKEIARRVVDHGLSVEGMQGEIEQAVIRVESQARRDEDRKNREAARLEAFGDKLSKAKLDPARVTLVYPGPGTVADVLAKLATQGWKTKVGGQVETPVKGICDCTAWTFTIRYEYMGGRETEKVSLHRACISKKHLQRAEGERREAWEAEQRERRERAEAEAAEREAALAPAISALTTAIPPGKAKLLLMALIAGDRNGNSWWDVAPWIERITGTAPGYDGWMLKLWKAIDGLEHERLLAEIARAVAERILEAGPDPARELLDGLVNAPDQAKARTAEKRAARVAAKPTGSPTGGSPTDG